MGTTKQTIEEKSPEIVALENQLKEALEKNKALEDKFLNLEPAIFSELQDALIISYNFHIDKINQIISTFNDKQRLVFEKHNIDFGKNYSTDKFRMQELPYFEKKSELPKMKQQIKK